MNTKIAYACRHCAHSEVMDFAKPPEVCSNCGEPVSKLELPQETVLPKKIIFDTIKETEVVEDDQD